MTQIYLQQKKCIGNGKTNTGWTMQKMQEHQCILKTAEESKLSNTLRKRIKKSMRK